MNHIVSGKIRDVFNNMSEVKAYIDTLESDKKALEGRCDLWDKTISELTKDNQNKYNIIKNHEVGIGALSDLIDKLRIENKKLQEEISDHHKLHNANKKSIDDANERLKRQSVLLEEKFTEENGLNDQIDALKSLNSQSNKMILEEKSRINRINSAVMSISEERFRQRSVEGLDSFHDDRHKASELIRAAVCYAVAAFDMENQYHISFKDFILGVIWPWEKEWWKPSDPRRNLVKAGALIVAEIERIDRASVKS